MSSEGRNLESILEESCKNSFDLEEDFSRFKSSQEVLAKSKEEKTTTRNPFENNNFTSYSYKSPSPSTSVSLKKKTFKNPEEKLKSIFHRKKGYFHGDFSFISFLPFARGIYYKPQDKIEVEANPYNPGKEGYKTGIHEVIHSLGYGERKTRAKVQEYYFVQALGQNTSFQFLG